MDHATPPLQLPRACKARTLRTAVVGHLGQAVTVIVLEVVLGVAAERTVVRDAVAEQVAVGP